MYCYSFKKETDTVDRMEPVKTIFLKEIKTAESPIQTWKNINNVHFKIKDLI
jgi:hypothetical protein